MSFSKLRTCLDFDVENCNVAHVRGGPVQPQEVRVDAVPVVLEGAALTAYEPALVGDADFRVGTVLARGTVSVTGQLR